MKIKEIMHKATTVDKTMSILEVSKLMTKKKIGSVLIKKNGCIMVVTERDILTKVLAEDKDMKKTKVLDIMTKCSHTLDSESDVFDASEIFNKHNIRRLPITEKGKIIGMVTARDVAKSLSYVGLKAGITKKYAKTRYR